MALLMVRCLPLALLILAVFTNSHHQAAASRKLSTMSSTMLEKHELWMAKHNKEYKDAEEKARRFQVFKANIELIKSFNAGNHKFKLEANQFADLTTDEFKEICSGFRPPLMTTVAAAKGLMYGNVTAECPSSMDWRAKGAVTPVKQQGHCGSCWAFSAVAAMEGLTHLKTGNLIPLSEQELMDCDTSGENQACNGGQMTKAFDFAANNEGLSAETNYPYMGTKTKYGGICKSKKSFNHALTISGYESVPTNNEAALLKAAANQPISVAVDAGGFAFQFYSSGVLSSTGAQCGTDLNHGMTVVGYDTAADGTKYWILKNSWGSSWGENGYIRMERDVDGVEGLCGIAMQASYPIA